MNYADIKALLGKVFQVNPDEFRTITDMHNHAKEKAFTTDQTKLFTYEEASACDLLIKYIDGLDD